VPEVNFLDWLADRLVHVYGESPNVDFVLKLRELAPAPAADVGLRRTLTEIKRRAMMGADADPRRSESATVAVSMCQLIAESADAILNRLASGPARPVADAQEGRTDWLAKACEEQALRIVAEHDLAVFRAEAHEQRERAEAAERERDQHKHVANCNHDLAVQQLDRADAAEAALAEARQEIARQFEQIKEWSKCNLEIVAKCVAVEKELAALKAQP
jgi:hypothetical protein